MRICVLAKVAEAVCIVCLCSICLRCYSDMRGMTQLPLYELEFS